jgi:two-component system nitrogen regulation sensor histidine kinase NtrY
MKFPALHRRIWWWLGVAALSIVALRTLPSTYQPERILSRAEADLADFIQIQQQSAQTLLADTRFWQQLALTSGPPGQQTTTNLPKAPFSEQGFNLVLYQQDSLVFWLHNSFPLSSGPFEDGLKTLPEGQYLIKPVASPLPDADLAQLIIPLCPSPPIAETNPVFFPLSSAFQVADIDLNGQPSLTLVSDAPSPQLQRWQWWLWILFALMMCLLINQLALYSSRRWSPWVGGVLLAIALAILRQGSIAFAWGETFSQLPNVAIVFQTMVWQISLGDWLINILLLLWLMTFFHREFKLLQVPHLPRSTAFLVNSMNYGTILTAMVLTTLAFRQLVLNSSIDFNLDNVFDQSLPAILALLGTLLLILAFFLFAHRMARAILATGISPLDRTICYAAVTLLAGLLVGWSGIDLPALIFIPAALAFFALLDLFVDNNDPNLAWLTLWLIVLSSLSTGLLSRFHQVKERQRQYELAQAFSAPRDRVAEFWLQKSWEKNQQQMVSEGEQLPYLSSFYRPVASTDSSLLQTAWKKGVVLSESSPFRCYQPPGQAPVYTLKTDSLTYGWMRHIRPQQGMLNQLILDQPFKGLEPLEQQQISVYQNLALTEYNYSEVDEQKPNPENIPDPGKIVQAFENGKLSTYLSPGPETLVVLRKDRTTLPKAVSLFSFLFVMQLALVPILFLLNRWLKVLPDDLDFSTLDLRTLRNRIQYGVVAITLISFIIIGGITVQHFLQNSQYNQELLVKQQIEMVRTDAIQTVLPNEKDSLEQVLKQLAGIHRTDLLLYNNAGQLLGSSLPALDDLNHLPLRMDMRSLQELRSGQKVLTIHEEDSRSAAYRVAYLGLPGKNGDLQGFLGIPFFARSSALQSDVSDFIGSLINVYAFLLLLAAVLAISMVRSITRPLTELQAGLQRLKLGVNEPLSWNRSDELGELIAQYNQTLAQLEASSRKLAQTEREMAWRSMAKQVAHEIKNPLTPIRLKLQHLRYLYKRDPEQAQQKFQKDSEEIIEQLDLLKEIASDFSAFAKLSETHLEPVELNTLTKAVLDLFSNEADQTTFTWAPFPEEVWANAEQGQFRRILNNLYQNALQAIPEERAGKIHTRIETRDDKIILSVSDNGTGIPAATQPRIFEPDFTTKSSGSGLGLFMCRSMVEHMLGTIYFETEADKGTTFFVEIPRLAREEATTEHELNQ